MAHNFNRQACQHDANRNRLGFGSSGGNPVTLCHAGRRRVENLSGFLLFRRCFVVVRTWRDLGAYVAASLKDRPPGKSVRSDERSLRPTTKHRHVRARIDTANGLHGLNPRNTVTRYTPRFSTGLGAGIGNAVGISGGKLGQRLKRMHPSWALGPFLSDSIHCRMQTETAGAGRIRDTLSTLGRTMEKTA